MFKALFFSAAVMATFSGAAYAQTSAAPMATGMSMTAPDFVTAASQSDMFEIQEGKMAQAMGSAAVRRFGARMVKDHMKTTANLHAAIRKAGMTVPPPPALRPDQQQMMGQLQGMSGPAFDKAYLTQQVQSHQEALDLQSGYAKAGDVPAIRTAAKGAVPIVTMHLKMAQKMSSM